MKNLQIVPLFLWFLFSTHAAVIPTNAPPAKPPLQIVTLRKGVNMEGLIHEHGLSPKFRYRAFNSFAAPMPEAVIQKLKADGRVMFVEADGPVALCGQIDNVTNSQVNSFGLMRMGFDHFPPAHVSGIPKSLDVDVAVMDTGIDPHEDLPPSYHDACMFSENTRDEGGHGTAIAGIIGALDNGFGIVGVAPGVRIWNIKVIDSSGIGSFTDIISGMDYIYQFSNQISVVNMSFGNVGTSAPINAEHYFLQQLVEAGIVVVAAAGNAAKDIAGSDGVFGTGDDVVPAADPYAMAISAMDPTIDDPATAVSRDHFWWTTTAGVGSNFNQVERTNGTTPYYTNFVSSPGGAIDVAAPGVNIATTLPVNSGFHYGFKTGTSVAAPHVTGLVALYIATHGRATNAAGVFAIRQAIINAALPQSQWRPNGFPFDAVTNNTADPDTHPEPLAMASESLVPPPRITQTAGAPGNFQTHFATVPGYDYTLQSATNLTPPIAWTNVATRTGSTFLATVSVTDSNAASQNFYRLARKSLTGPPLINAQLQSLEVPLGETATFHVVVAGVPPFNCRWQKGTSPLPDDGDVLGASSIPLTLTITNVQLADAGDYSIVITNAYGSVTSAVATLTVLTNWTSAIVTGVLATATSEVPAPFNNYASNAVNGALNWAWESVGNDYQKDFNPAITFDLGAVRALESLQIWSGPQSGVAVTQMHIETSNDGIGFNTLGNFTLTTLSPASETISLGGVTTRYVRLNWLRNASGQYPPGPVMIDEVKFYEYLENTNPSP